MSKRNSQKKKLNIVIVVSYTYPFIGSGIGQVALIQAEKLVTLGHKVALISSNYPYANEKRFKKNGVLHLKLHAINFLEKFHIPVPLFIFSSEVMSLIKGADVVHAHGMLYPSSLLASVFTKLFKKPFILTQHASYIEYDNWIINWLEKLVRATMGRLVVTLSKKVIIVNDGVRTWLGVDNGKIVTIINGVDTSLFRPVNTDKKKLLRKKYSLPQQKKVILYVGRLVPKKGYKELYKARGKDYLIVFVGGGSVPYYMKKDQNVCFLGRLEQNKLSEIYQASDVFALPSMCEGFPLTIQEAMASGLPIITTKHPGFDKYLDKRCVMFIEPAGEEIKKAIKRILDDKQLTDKMRKYSRDEAIAKISWDSNISNLLDVYYGVIK